MVTATAKADIVVRIRGVVVQIDAEQPRIARIVPIAATFDSPARSFNSIQPNSKSILGTILFVPSSQHSANFVHKL